MTNVSGTISTNTTWVTGEVYWITGDTTVGSGVKLTVEPGAIVKFDPGTSLVVNGELEAIATFASRSYFTSIKDDSVGGDTNGDGSATSPAAGNWGEIRIASTATGSFDFSDIKFGGSSTNATNLALTGGFLEISNSIIASSSTNGISIANGTANIDNNLIENHVRGVWIGGGNATINLIDNDFEDNSTAAVVATLTGGNQITTSGNTSTGGGYSGSPAGSGMVLMGQLDANMTFNKEFAYFLSNNFTIPSWKTLTIQPGAIIKVLPGYNVTINGTLIADGTPEDPIYFTSYRDDTVGGDTNGDGSATTPAAGNWNEIKINSGGSATMDNVVAKYGGNSGQIINNNAGNLELTNSAVSYSPGAGVAISGGTVDIIGNQINNNNNGVWIDSGTATVVLQNNSFADNNVFSVHANVSGGNQITTSGNSASGGALGGSPGGHAMRLYGALSNNMTLNEEFPYIFHDNAFSVPAGKTLTINPGAIIKPYSAGLSVSGNLVINGSSAKPVYFTSWKDDSVGGDTNGDSSATSPASGNWGTIAINSGGTADINHAVIRYGGFDGISYSLVYNNGGDVDIEDSSFSNAYSVGFRIGGGTAYLLDNQFTGANTAVLVTAGTVNVTGNEITSNTYGIYASGGTVTASDNYIVGNTTGIHKTASPTLTAENNWWGNVSGPYNASTNPSGTGDPVSNNVDFTPWLDQWINTDIANPVSGTITTNTTWNDALPYVIGPNGVTVDNGATLTINPGTIVKFNGPTSKLTIDDGHLQVNGASTSFVYFTSFKDDSAGGDTNEDGASSGSAGDWSYVKIASDSMASVSYSIIKYGGSTSGNSSMVYVDGGSLDANQIRVNNSFDKGIRVDSGSELQVSRAVINDNDYGIVISGSAQTIDIWDSYIYDNQTADLDNISSSHINAEQNWWGDETGPYHVSSNPSGLGSIVTGDTDFSPWHYSYNSGSVNPETKQLLWGASTDYTGDLSASLSIWQSLYLVTISSSSEPYVYISDIDDSEADPGYYDPVPNPDEILLNSHWLDGDDSEFIQNVILHELGHALGLGHSFSGNVMYNSQTSQNYLGSQDISDYNFIWDW